MNLIPMRRMNIGQNGIVRRVRGGDPLSVRIREMGLVPGADVAIVGRAPLNDPVHIKLQGYDLTLRNNEADHIMVEVEESHE